jgi:hypothetical protein
MIDRAYRSGKTYLIANVHRVIEVIQKAPTGHPEKPNTQRLCQLLVDHRIIASPGSSQTPMKPDLPGHVFRRFDPEEVRIESQQMQRPHIGMESESSAGQRLGATHDE